MQKVLIRLLAGTQKQQNQIICNVLILIFVFGRWLPEQTLRVSVIRISIVIRVSIVSLSTITGISIIGLPTAWISCRSLAIAISSLGGIRRLPSIGVCATVCSVAIICPVIAAEEKWNEKVDAMVSKVAYC